MLLLSSPASSPSLLSQSVPSAASSSSPLQMSVSTAPLWVQNAGKLAPWASIGVVMAPIPTIRDVVQKKNVGSLPLLPYSTMIDNAFLWVVYGILKKEPKLWSCNGVGLILGLSYFTLFVKNIPKKTSTAVSSTLPGTVAQHVQGIAAIVAGTLALIVLLREPASLIGNLGVLLCVCLFASPLAALKTVLETKSAKSIPLPFTLASVFNCLLWSAVGLLEMKDFNIYFPNLLGLSFGLIQLLLKLIYGNGTSGAVSVDLPM